MSLNEDELKKIERATSGWFKKSVRSAIAASLSALKPRVEAMKKLPNSERNAELKKLVNEATNARHKALQSGASDYDHPEWAAAAACESWLHELFYGTTESIARVEALVDELSKRK